MSDEGEVDESGEHFVELVETRKDSAEGFEAEKEAFDFVPFFVEFLIISPWMRAVYFWRNYGLQAEIQSQLSRLIAFVGAIHDDRF